MRSSTEDLDFRTRAVACLDGLYAFARSLCRDAAMADDLVQETYVRAFRAARRPAPLEDVRPWLFTILHNVWRNERRGHAPEPIDELPEAADSPLAFRPQAEEDLDRSAVVDRVGRAVDELPDAYHEVVMLRFGEGLSYREIAGVLGCPAGTVMSRLARARALIRRALDGAGLRRVAGGRS
jgi:RNA polymerase sigma-70 factor (ECF subfamily)